MRLPIILIAFAMFTTVLHAQEPVKQQHVSPAITLARVVSDLERKAEKLTQEHFAIRAEGKDAKAPLPALDKDKSVALRAITQHLIERRNLLSNKSTPSDPYYHAIQQQLHANSNLDTLKVWWTHCRKGTNFESLPEFDRLPLAIELIKAKTTADKKVSENQPITEEPESVEIKSIDPLIISRITGGNSILDQIDGWKELPEESKSKIISR